LVFQLQIQLAEGGVAHAAYVVEGFEDDDGVRRWWATHMLYTTDPVTKLGVPEQWKDVPETATDAELPPFLRELVIVGPGARAARVLPPQPATPSFKAGFGELHASLPTPTDIEGYMQATMGLFAVDLLAGRLSGTAIVRFSERLWEAWVLDGPLPASLEDMLRYLANNRGPVADAIALIQTAIRPEDEPPVPGIQVVAEHAGLTSELWGPIEFLDDGNKRIPQVHMRTPQPVAPGGMWLGVDPVVTFDLTGFGAEA
jgi:hypothetical protein